MRMCALNAPSKLGKDKDQMFFLVDIHVKM